MQEDKLLESVDKPWLKSKKFIAMLFGTVLLTASGFSFAFFLGADATTVFNYLGGFVVAIILAYLGSQGASEAYVKKEAVKTKTTNELKGRSVLSEMSEVDIPIDLRQDHINSSLPPKLKGR